MNPALIFASRADKRSSVNDSFNTPESSIIYIFEIIKALFVPPKPKLLFNMVLILIPVMVLEGIFKPFAHSSGFSRLMFGATKSFCIIIIEYTVSLAPAIQHSWPVMDFVELIIVRLPANKRDNALASYMSPCGVEVAWALT